MNFNDEVMRLRNEYRSCLKLANETDSKKEDASLRKDAAFALERLRELCTHDYTVLLSREYEGSYSDDYTDAHPEKRQCLCCGILEYAYGKKFESLVSQPIVVCHKQIADPLNYLLSEAIELAMET